MKRLEININTKINNIREQIAEEKRNFEKARGSVFTAPENIGAMEGDLAAFESAAERRIQNIKAGGIAVSGAIGLALRAGKSYLNYRLGGIQYETGDSNYTAQVNEVYSDTMTWIGMGTNLIGSTIGGLLFGGPIGAAVGAAVSIGNSAISVVTNNATEERKLNYEIWQDTVKIDYNKASKYVVQYGGGRLR